MSDTTAKPVRIQLSRKKGWRMPENTVKVDRTTKWGNPYVARDYPTPEKAVQRFRSAVMGFTSNGSFCPPDAHPESYIGTIIRTAGELRGKNLACWCPLHLPCHADVLLELANAQKDESHD